MRRFLTGYLTFWSLLFLLGFSVFHLARCYQEDVLRSRGWHKAEDGTMVQPGYYDSTDYVPYSEDKEELEEDDCAHNGGTDWCRCLDDPETCEQADPELYRRVWGRR